MFPDPDIDMIGARDLEEEMELNIGHGHVLYTGGANGNDELAEDMAKHFGMQVEVIVPPPIIPGPIGQSFRGRSLSPSQSSHQPGCS